MSSNVSATGNHEAVSNQHAYDEAMRELQVRERMYPRWVSEGKISRTEARTRLDAQARICFILAKSEGVSVAEAIADGGCPF